MNLVLIYDYLKTEYGYLIRIGLYSFRFLMFIQCSICILVLFYNIFYFQGNVIHYIYYKLSGIYVDKQVFFSFIYKHSTALFVNFISYFLLLEIGSFKIKTNMNKSFQEFYVLCPYC